MSGRAWLVVALVAGFAAQSRAQVPLTLACNDRSGRAVTPVQVTNGMIAVAKVDQDGRPVIEYDQRPIAGISPQQRLFVYAHECGHHALGHDRPGQSTNLTQEQDADCYAIRSLMAGRCSDCGPGAEKNCWSRAHGCGGHAETD